MARKASVVIEKDEHGFYAWCPELKGCQSQGNTLEQAIANIKEAIELYLETLPAEERDVLLSREILTTAVEVNAYATEVDDGQGSARSAGSRLRTPSLKGQSPNLRQGPTQGNSAFSQRRRSSSQNRQAGARNH